MIEIYFGIDNLFITACLLNMERVKEGKMIYGMNDRLKSLRMQRGYSQKLVAARIKTTQAEISRYESGEKTPRIERLIQLSVIYNCSLDYIAGKDVRRNPWEDDEGICSGMRKTRK